MKKGKNGGGNSFIQSSAEMGYQIGEPYFDYSDYEDHHKGVGRTMEPSRSKSAAVMMSTIRNITAQLGTTTYLHCKVNSLGGKTVCATS